MSPDIDPVELALIGPILMGDEPSLLEVEAVRRLGFLPSHFTSFTCRQIWVTGTKLLDAGSFTQEKLASQCLQDPLFGPTPGERAAWIAEARGMGLFIQMREHASDLMERDLKLQIKAAAQLSDGTSQELMDGLEARLTAIRAKASFKIVDQKLEGCNDVQSELEAMARGENPMKSSGNKLWDQCIGGLPEACSIILAGRPGSGKTSAAEDLIDLNVTRFDSALYIQGELSRSRAIARLACRQARVPFSAFHYRRLTSDQNARLLRRIEEYKRLPLFLIPCRNINAGNVGAMIRYHAKHHNTKLVVLDYVQLMIPPRGQDMRMAVSELTRALKQAANDTGATVVSLAQLGRTVKVGMKPTDSDLKESGSIEQDADTILALWLPEERDDNAKFYQVNWSLLKNRNGAHGTVETIFNGETMTFTRKV